MSPPSRDTSSGVDLPTVCWPCRVDPDCISPDVKNSIHVGDRILEIAVILVADDLSIIDHTSSLVDFTRNPPGSPGL